MPIEFRCSQCSKLLRTPDETAGKQAKCPECGSILTVPTPGAASPPPVRPEPASPPPASPPPGSPFASQPSPGMAAGSPFASEGPQPTGDPDNPYRSPGDYTAAGPRPGVSSGPFTPSIIEIGDIFGRTWDIFKDNWGMCLLAVIVVFVINMVVQGVVGVFATMVGAMAGDEVIAVTASILGNLVSTLFSVWIAIGQSLFFLKVARGQDAGLEDIFTGAPFFLTVLLASILFWLIMVVGFVALIIPGIIFSLMFSQYYYLILDRNVGVMDSLSLSKEITTGNKLMLFVIGIISTLLMIVAILPCGLGLLIAGPYFTLMYPVIYLTMTGQPTADQYQYYEAPPA